VAGDTSTAPILTHVYWLRPLKKCPGRNKKRVELRPPTAAVDLQLRPVPYGVPTPRHLQLRPEAAPTPPRWTHNPGASRAPAVAARRAPTSAPPAPAVVAAHLGTCISGQSPPPLRRPITRAQAPAVTCRRRPPGRSIVGPDRARPSSCQQGRDSLSSIAHLVQRYSIAHFFSLFPFGCVLDCARNGSGAVMWKRSESL